MHSIIVKVRHDPLFKAVANKARRNEEFLKSLEVLDQLVVCDFAGGDIVCHFTDEVLDLFYEAV